MNETGASRTIARRATSPWHNEGLSLLFKLGLKVPAPFTLTGADIHHSRALAASANVAIWRYIGSAVPIGRSSPPSGGKSEASEVVLISRALPQEPALPGGAADVSQWNVSLVCR